MTDEGAKAPKTTPTPVEAIPVQTSLLVPSVEEETRAALYSDLDETITQRLRALSARGTIDFDSLASDAAIVDLSEYGVGAPLDKDDLTGVPFIVADWHTIHEGTFGPYVFVEVVTKVPVPAKRDDTAARDTPAQMVTHGFFVDGGSGIPKFLDDSLARSGGRRAGLYAPRGLTRSDYTTDLGGTLPKAIEATTFYFAG